MAKSTTKLKIIKNEKSGMAKYNSNKNENLPNLKSRGMIFMFGNFIMFAQVRI